MAPRRALRPPRALQGMAAAMRKQVYAAEFKVLVDKTDGQMLGLTLSSQRDRGYLKIKKVKTSGLVQQWNDDHPDLAVQPGDRIV